MKVEFASLFLTLNRHLPRSYMDFFIKFPMKHFVLRLPLQFTSCLQEDSMRLWEMSQDITSWKTQQHADCSNRNCLNMTNIWIIVFQEFLLSERVGESFLLFNYVRNWLEIVKIVKENFFCFTFQNYKRSKKISKFMQITWLERSWRVYSLENLWHFFGNFDPSCKLDLLLEIGLSPPPPPPTSIRFFTRFVKKSISFIFQIQS